MANKTLSIDPGIIQGRRAKLEADIAQLRERMEQRIGEIEAKLAELSVAERIVAELALEGAEPNRAEPPADESRPVPK